MRSVGSCAVLSLGLLLAFSAFAFAAPGSVVFGFTFDASGARLSGVDFSDFELSSSAYSGSLVEARFYSQDALLYSFNVSDPAYLLIENGSGASIGVADNGSFVVYAPFDSRLGRVELWRNGSLWANDSFYGVVDDYIESTAINSAGASPAAPSPSAAAPSASPSPTVKHNAAPAGTWFDFWLPIAFVVCLILLVLALSWAASGGRK